MHVRIPQLLILGALFTSISYLAPATARASAPGSGVHAAASTPKGAVLRITQPFVNRSAQSAACNAMMGKLVGCPMTQRLRAAVARELQWERAHPGGNGNEFCRCQNPPRRIVISAVRHHGQTADVVTAWYWGARPVKISWVTRHTVAGWLVDNNYCTGYPKRDLYHIPVGPCPSP